MDHEHEVAVQRRPTAAARVLLVLLVVGFGVLVAVDFTQEPGPSSPPSTTEPSTTERTTPQESAPPDTPTGTAVDGSVVQIATVLDGDPLEAPTGLELLVGDSIVHVDGGGTRSINGLPDEEFRPIQAFSVGTHSVLAFMEDCQSQCEDALETRVYTVADGQTEATQILTGKSMFAAPGEDRLWITTHHNEDDCTVHAIGLEGQQLFSPRAIRCGLRIRADTAVGLVAYDSELADGQPGGFNDDVVLDPVTLDELFRAPGIHAVIGEQVIVTARDRSFSLVDIDSNAARPLPTPPALGDPVDGIVSPDGRYVLIEFVGPQGDLWVLDLESEEWIHVPGFPVEGHMRSLGPAWTPDGQLVARGWFRHADTGEQPAETLLVWRPGEARVSIRQIDLLDHPLLPLLVRP